MFKTIKSKLIAIFAVASSCLTLPAFATSPSGLPTTAPPSTGASTNYIDMIQGYALDIFIVAGLLIGTVAFIMVARNVVQVYGEIADGRKSWGDMGSHAIAGVLLLVFVIYMLTEASTILV